MLTPAAVMSTVRGYTALARVHGMGPPTHNTQYFGTQDPYAAVALLRLPATSMFTSAEAARRRARRRARRWRGGASYAEAHVGSPCAEVARVRHCATLRFDAVPSMAP